MEQSEERAPDGSPPEAGVEKRRQIAARNGPGWHGGRGDARRSARGPFRPA